jgi:hypothetical protein
VASKRPKTPEERSAAPGACANEPASSVAVSPPALAGALILLAVVSVLQLAMWFGAFSGAPGQAEDAEFQRRTTVILLASPDRMVELWCGNKLAYFSIFDRAPVAMAVAAIFSAAWVTGRVALDLLGITRLLDRLERCVFSLAAGLNLLSLYALAVGLSGGLRVRWLFLVPLIGLIGWGCLKAVIAWRSGGHGDTTQPFDAEDRRWLWWLLPLTPYIVMMLLGAILPPYEYDVREYHLQVPKEWFQQGRIDFLPHNIYGNMPLGSELTALWGMAFFGGDDAWWWGAIVGKSVMACYSLVTIAGLIAFGRRVHSTAAGVLAALAYGSTPWILHVSLVGYNEGPTALYFLTALFAVWLAWRAGDSAASVRLVGLAGFLAGAAVACKYPPALFLVVPLGGWIVIQPFLAARPDNWRLTIGRRALVATAIFLAGVSAGCGLWLAKNAALSGNPTYPLLYGIFDGKTRTPEKDLQWRRVHSPQPDASRRRFTVQRLGQDMVWNLWRTRGASLVLLPLALAAGLAMGRRRFVGLVVLWLLFIGLAWWLLTHRLDRFLVPAIPLVALLAGIGGTALPHVAWHRAALGLVIFGLVVQFPFASLTLGDHRYFAPLEGLRRDDVRLAEVRGLRIDIPHRWLNSHVSEDQRVLLVGDAEPFDLEMPTIYNTCFDDCQFARIFEGRTRDERLAILHQEGITHIFFSWAHLKRYRSPGNYGYTSDYVTRELVHRELVAEQRLLRKVNIDDPAELGLPPEVRLDPELGEIFEVIGR